MSEKKRRRGRIHSTVDDLPEPLKSQFEVKLANPANTYEELVYNAGDYPANLLERLLSLDSPLETAREQWIRKENAELSERLGCVLQSIWEPEQNMEEEHGPEMAM